MASTRKASVLAVIFCTVLMTASQFLYKEGMQRFRPDLLSILTNYHLLIGMAIYILVAVIIIYSLKEGEMSVLMPVLATSYIWVVLGSYVFYAEPLGIFKVSGIMAIAGGVSLIGLGGGAA